MTPLHTVSPYHDQDTHFTLSSEFENPYEMMAKPLATTKVLVAQFLGLLCQLRRHMDHTYRDHQPPSKS